MRRNFSVSLLTAVSLCAAGAAAAAGVREFTRMTPGTTVSDAQASELTLTLTDAAMRPIQNWVRTSGALDKSGRVLTTFVRSPEADWIAPGQRVNTYTVNTRTRMTLGRVAGIAKQSGGARIEVALPTALTSDGTRYLMEIVVERGPFLSVPNAAIIEEGAEHVVYIQKEPGRYAPQIIETGLQGELYTEVTGGLAEGDQIVSVGSFFVDAENKLKSAGMAAMPGMDHGAMAGMDHSAMTEVAANAPSPASAPREVMSDPAPGATVKAPLAMIHVMFPAPIDLKTARMTVADGSGKPVDPGDVMPMGNDGRMLMAMPKAPLPKGNYTVKWQAAGADGKQLQGEFSFTAQ